MTLHPRLFTLALAGAASTLTALLAGQQTRPQGPCDIYAAAGTACVTAHSTVRSLSSRYGGPLYQVKRADGRLLDIGVIGGGFANAAAQDRFCAGTLCYINRIYDQSGRGNDLMQAPPGPLYPGPDKGAFDTQPIADMAPITIGGGHKAYGVYIMPGMGFRNNNARDLPIDDEPAGIHAVVDGGHYSNGCCFNYGNASTNGLAVGTGTMESVYFGTSTGWGSGSGTGPWIMSDMEAGLFSGYNARVNEANPTITWRFVTGVFGSGGRNFWELKGGDAQQGGGGAHPSHQHVLSARCFDLDHLASLRRRAAGEAGARLGLGTRGWCCSGSHLGHRRRDRPRRHAVSCESAGSY